MNIKYFSELSDEAIYGMNELADLYLKTNDFEMKINVFGMMYSLLFQKVGTFFIGYNDNYEKVSFGYFTEGGHERAHKRILFLL